MNIIVTVDIIDYLVAHSGFILSLSSQPGHSQTPGNHWGFQWPKSNWWTSLEFDWTWLIVILRSSSLGHMTCYFRSETKILLEPVCSEENICKTTQPPNNPLCLVNRNPWKGEIVTSQLSNNWKGQCPVKCQTNRQKGWQGGRVLRCQTNNWPEIVHLPKESVLAWRLKHFIFQTVFFTYFWFSHQFIHRIFSGL